VTDLAFASAFDLPSAFSVQKWRRQKWANKNVLAAKRGSIDWQPEGQEAAAKRQQQQQRQGKTKLCGEKKRRSEVFHFSTHTH